jgi:hypothetical protein
MSKPNPAELPGSMVVLGLLIEKPGQSVAEVAQSLESRFSHSRFDPATAHNALPQMARGGRGQPRVRCIHLTPGRGHRAQDRYVPTDEGVSVYRAWMRAVPSESGPPALREALYGHKHSNFEGCEVPRSQKRSWTGVVLEATFSQQSPLGCQLPESFGWLAMGVWVPAVSDLITVHHRGL